MAASHLSLCPTLVHLEDLPDKRKMSYGRINRQKQIENEQKKISFYPVGDPRVPKRVLGGWLKKCRNLKFQMGITGAPFGPIGMKICPTTPPSRAFARGKGFRVPGGWGVGKKLKNVSFLGHFFLNFLQIFKKK